MASVKKQLERSIEKTNKIKSIEFKSTNNLLFETAPFYTPDVTRFRVGTCTGIYSCEGSKYVIIGITNHSPGNGHLQDVFDWFENSCKRDKKDLMVAELMNHRFKKHLIEKRNFEIIKNPYGKNMDLDNYVIKYLKDIKK